MMTVLFKKNCFFYCMVFIYFYFSNLSFVFFLPKQCVGIPVLKTILLHVYKCLISDSFSQVIFCLVMSSLGGPGMADR